MITALRGKLVEKPETKMWYTTSVSFSNNIKNEEKGEKRKKRGTRRASSVSNSNFFYKTEGLREKGGG